MKKYFIVLIAILLVFAACAPKPLEGPGVQRGNVKQGQDEDLPPQPPQTQQGEQSKSMPASAPNTVKILGQDGFEPKDISISSGSTVTWVNKDAVKLTITIFKDGVFFANSEIVEPEQSISIKFDEKGSYEYWSVDYGVRAYITVN